MITLTVQDNKPTQPNPSPPKEVPNPSENNPSDTPPTPEINPNQPID